MAQVTQAEIWVNEYCGQTFTGTIPAGIVGATKLMARYYMEMIMMSDGYIEKLSSPLKTIMQLCEVFLLKHKVTVSYSSSKSDFDMRLLMG